MAQDKDKTPSKQPEPPKKPDPSPPPFKKTGRKVTDSEKRKEGDWAGPRRQD